MFVMNMTTPADVNHLSLKGETLAIALAEECVLTRGLYPSVSQTTDGNPAPVALFCR